MSQNVSNFSGFITQRFKGLHVVYISETRRLLLISFTNSYSFLRFCRKNISNILKAPKMHYSSEFKPYKTSRTFRTCDMTQSDMKELQLD